MNDELWKDLGVMSKVRSGSLPHCIPCAEAGPDAKSSPRKRDLFEKWTLLLLGSFFLEAKGRALLNRRRGEDAAAMQTEEW